MINFPIEKKSILNLITCISNTLYSGKKMSIINVLISLFLVKQDSCIVKLEAAVKTCLTQNSIDVPDVMSAFEPFNDVKSRILCE